MIVVQTDVQIRRNGFCDIGNPGRGLVGLVIYLLPCEGYSWGRSVALGG
jgi:hypothetical protein